jgi:hypothetical protein
VDVAVCLYLLLVDVAVCLYLLLVLCTLACGRCLGEVLGLDETDDTMWVMSFNSK